MFNILVLGNQAFFRVDSYERKNNLGASSEKNVEI